MPLKANNRTGTVPATGTQGTSPGLTRKQYTGTKPAYTRPQLAKRIGVSLSEVRRRVQVGLLVPVGTNEYGHELFTDDPVATADAVTYTADEAIAMFEALSQGKTLLEAVIVAKVHPNVARKICAEWESLSGAIVLTKEHMGIINELPLEGTFPIKSATELVAMLKKQSNDFCSECHERPRVHCAICTKKVANRAVRDYRQKLEALSAPTEPNSGDEGSPSLAASEATPTPTPSSEGQT